MIGKKRIGKTLTMLGLTAVLSIAPAITIFLISDNIEEKYGDTYYAVLHKMHSRIENSKKNKIIIIGNSNIPFGVDSRLAENLLNDVGLDYEVCNFGLYGSLGTKMMLDLAKDDIKKDDIVVFAPELAAPSLSLYFSAEEAWYALEADKTMFNEFDQEAKKQLIASYPTFASKKYALESKGVKASPSGIYASSSFDERCDLRNYAHPYNTMPDGVDQNVSISLKTDVFSNEFVCYANEYSNYVQSLGARMFYSFSPMNKGAIENLNENNIETLMTFIYESFSFPLISDVEDYIMDSGWFFDTNFHLNDSGMMLRTYNLVNDIKNALGNTTKTELIIPEMPIAPNKGIEGEGDNSCASLFTYSLNGNYWTVEGLKEEAREKEELVVPYQVDGLYVKSFTETVFNDAKSLRTIRIQENIKFISDNSFKGCTKLEKIILNHTEPSDISVGSNLKSGTNCLIYVPEDSLSKFANDYNWGKYAKDLRGY